MGVLTHTYTHIEFDQLLWHTNTSLLFLSSCTHICTRRKIKELRLGLACRDRRIQELEGELLQHRRRERLPHAAGKLVASSNYIHAYTAGA